MSANDGGQGGPPHGGGGGGTGGGGGGGTPPDPRISLTVPNQTVLEGVILSQPLATFTDPDLSALGLQYTATAQLAPASRPIPLTVTQTAGGFAVSGLVTFNDAGSYLLCINVLDMDSPNGAQSCGTVTVTEAPITPYGRSWASLANQPCQMVTVAEFVDGNQRPPAGEFTFTVNWGDGTVDTGTYVAPIGAEPDEIAIKGCHTYSDLGPHTVTTTLVDSNLSVSATSTAWVYALTDGGSFVIGDGSSSMGSPVTFSGAAWNGANTLSGGPAPDSFKGYADGSAPACNATWSTGPGNSSAPPATVPSYTAVVVSSTITKQGPHITGDTVHVALVRADAGYGPSPGQPGTGTVVFMIC